jgi:hypothetical protein
VGVETTQDYRKQAEECIAMALQSADNTDKALWVTLAQSWVRLALQAETSLAPEPDDESMMLEMTLPDQD